MKPSIGPHYVTPELSLARLDPELVNTTTAGAQTSATIEALGDGGFVVAWISIEPSGLQSGLYLQRYDAAGVKLGEETFVATNPASSQFPVLAGLGDGGWVIAYATSEVRSSFISTSVLLHRLGADGNPVGGVIPIAGFSFNPLVTHEFTLVGEPSVAPLADGGYVVSWRQDNFFATTSGLHTALQSYDSSGALVSTQFFPGDTPVEAMSEGGFRVGNLLFDGSSAIVGAVNASDVTGTRAWSVDELAGGGYILVSLSLENVLYQQLLDGSGVPVGDRTVIAAASAESLPEVVALAGGSYVVLWPWRPEAGAPPELLAQQFDATGAAVDDTLHIAPPDSYAVTSSLDAAALPQGGFAVSGVGVGPAGPDVFVQTVPMALAGTTDNDWLAGTAVGDFLYGSFGRDHLLGLAGDDNLHGGHGADTMAGGAGDDSYFVDDPHDKITEQPGDGRDTVYSTISWRLERNVENLVLTGSGPVDGSGNELDNHITGNSAANRLTGGQGDDALVGRAGNDLLAGGAGNDVLDGGSGLDIFLFQEKPGADAADAVLNFNAGEDAIYLDSRDFRALGAAGPLNPDVFHEGAASAGPGDRLIYDLAARSLAYDADGAGGSEALAVATFVGLVGTLSALNFVVI